MTVLVVQSHPSEKSFNEAILTRVISHLDTARTDTTLIRLGKEKTILDINIKKPDSVIFIYPTWWGGYPASFLEWVNLVLATQNDLFVNVKSILSITTHGSSKLVNLVQGEWGRAYTKRKIATLCHTDVKLKWVSLYKIDRRADSELEEFLQAIGTELDRAIKN